MKMPRSDDRGTIAGRATIAGREAFPRKTRQDKKEPSGRRWRGRMEYQGVAVHAVAQSGPLRPVVENVAEVASVAAAGNFGPQHAEAPVIGFADRAVEPLIDARPA